MCFQLGSRQPRRRMQLLVYAVRAAEDHSHSYYWDESSANSKQSPAPHQATTRAKS
jgi:hypothetical protein